MSAKVAIAPESVNRIRLIPCILIDMELSNDVMSIKQWLGRGSINIFGRPFAGKDTQGRVLADMLNANLLGGGDILRNSEIPEDVQSELRAGKLAPTDEYIRIVLPYLSREEFADQPLILSSVGRWIGEEEGVLQVAQAAGHPIKAVIYLDLKEDTVRKRWHALHELQDRGDRHDDTLEVLETRLKEFREKTLPVVEKYRELGLLIDVDGEQPVETVTQSILQELRNHAKS